MSKHQRDLVAFFIPHQRGKKLKSRMVQQGNTASALHHCYFQRPRCQKQKMSTCFLFHLHINIYVHVAVLHVCMYVYIHIIHCMCMLQILLMIHQKIYMYMYVLPLSDLRVACSFKKYHRSRYMYYTCIYMYMHLLSIQNSFVNMIHVLVHL